LKFCSEKNPPQSHGVPCGSWAGYPEGNRMNIW